MCAICVYLTIPTELKFILITILFREIDAALQVVAIILFQVDYCV